MYISFVIYMLLLYFKFFCSKYLILLNDTYIYNLYVYMKERERDNLILCILNHIWKKFIIRVPYSPPL